MKSTGRRGLRWPDDGLVSGRSSKTWADDPQGQVSTDTRSKTGTTSRGTVAGRPRASKPTTEETVWDSELPFELEKSDAPPADVVANLVNKPTGSRRTLLAGIPLPLPPSLNSYYDTRIIFAKKQQRWMGIKYTTHEGKNYQNHIRGLMLERKAWFRSPHPLELRMLLCFRDERDRDLDNYVKVLQDALKNAHVFEDDSQIKLLEVRQGPTMTTPVVFVSLREILPDRNANLAWIKS